MARAICCEVCALTVCLPKKTGLNHDTCLPFSLRYLVHLLIAL